jgi:hypothetical protein
VIVEAFAAALTSGEVRFGWERSELDWNDFRAIAQVHLGSNLFDWFFNARTGYRGKFRESWEAGVAFNAEIIEAIRTHVKGIADPTVMVRLLDASFEDCGYATVPVDRISDSLLPDLSKVWFCTKLIRQEGGTACLPLGLSGPRILLDRGDSWAAPYRDDSDSWLDIKGAFLGAEGPYQPKDPVQRAKTLQLTGSA